MDKIRVLLADDHAVVRTGIRNALEKTAEMEVTGEAANGREALEKIRTLHPDVALLDIVMPELNGLEVIRLARKEGIRTQFVILSIHKNDAYVYETFLAGASAYLIKPCLTPNIIRAVRSVIKGEIFLSPRINSEFIRCFVRNRMRQQGELSVSPLSSCG